MDKLLAAVAASAGSISRHFKKSKKQTVEQPPSESSLNHKPPSPTSRKKWPFRRLFRRPSLKKDDGENVEKGNFVNEHLSFRSRKVVRPLRSLKQQSVRPFIVTDSSNVINTGNEDCYIVQKCQNCHSSVLDATLLVCIGMSFGVLYSFMENKREVEKLNLLVKQKENLVRDLEDEIEMKDSLIVQELTFETDAVLHDNKDSVVTKEKQNFSKIEAELEAELELLEHSMASSNLERKISDHFELDLDFEPGFAEGELRAEMLDNADDEFERGSTTTTTHSSNYMVSPRELRLRLHEVLQSQLEERIRELESQIEVQNQKSWEDFSSSNAGDENHEDKPVVLSLSGEALEAYNEASNDFAKFEESDEEFDDDGTPQNGGANGGDEVDFGDDDEMKLLIKHIVEKAKQGSPAVWNAQRALFSDQSLEVEKSHSFVSKEYI